MAMDGLSLAAAVAEARALVGGRIDKIQQPDKDELVLAVRSGGENYRLLLCASPEHCRLQLTGVKRENPIEAPAFCMLLRKRLSGGRILSIDQPNLDRSVYISIEAQNDLGDMVPYTLCAEIMGKYSNIILISEKGVIMDAIKRVGVGMSNVRTILPGLEYIAPPSQEKADPMQASPEDFYDAISGAMRPDKALSARFFGLAPSVAVKLLDSVTQGRGWEQLAEEERKKAAEDICEFYRRMSEGSFSAVMIIDHQGEPEGVLPFCPYGCDYREMPSIGEALDSFYAETDVIQRMRRQGAGIRKTLQNNIERCKKKLAMQDEAISSEGDIEKLRLYGELLTANAYALQQGSSEAAVYNYYMDPPEPVVIPLDSRLSPNDNAQKYYKKYQKAKAARDMAAEQREKTLEELEYLEGQLDNLDKCTGDSELRELSDELMNEGYIKRPKGKVQRLPTSKPMCFISSDGIEIYVGKNNRQNDMLTLKLAGPRDIWMHTKEIPGSHVIIKAEDPPKQTLYEGALLAAYYSKGRGGENIPVDYTEKRYVKKPSGAKPGMVIYTTNRTAYVTPDPAEIKAIKQKA